MSKSKLVKNKIDGKIFLSCREGRFGAVSKKKKGSEIRREKRTKTQTGRKFRYDAGQISGEENKKGNWYRNANLNFRLWINNTDDQREESCHL